MKDAVLQEGIDLEKALNVVTSNPARILCLSQKGNIAEGRDADLVLADQDTLEIDTVFARGQQMMSGKEILVKGTFE